MLLVLQIALLVALTRSFARADPKNPYSPPERD